MRIDELKQALGTIADDVGEVDRTEYVGEVHRKVRQARRAKAAGVSVGAAAAVAGILLVPGIVGSGDRSDVPPAEQPTESTPPYDTPLPTVEDNGVWFYEAPAGDRLVGHVVTQPGELGAATTVTPATTNLGFVVDCNDGEAPRGSRFRLLVDDQMVSFGRCRAPDGSREPLGVEMRMPPEEWAELGVRPDEPFELRVEVGEAARDVAAVGGAQLVAGVYELSDDLVGPAGIGLPRQVVFGGHTYEFRDLDYAIGDAPRSRLRVDTSALGDDLVAVVGVRGGAESASYDVLVEGEELSSTGGTGWSFPRSVSNDGEVAADIRRTGGPADDSTRFLAVYERID